MPPAPQGNQSDNSSGLLWGIAAAFAVLGVIWYAFRTKLAEAYLSVKLFEVDILNFISTRLHISPYYFDDTRLSILYAKNHIDAVTFSDLIKYGNEVGAWLRVPFVIILVVLAFVVYFGSSTRVYRRDYDMSGLADAEKNIWPQITPVLGLDLLTQDIDTGPWSMAMTPMQFCKKHRLLIEVRPERRDGPRKEWDKLDVVLKRGKANQLFAMQLGPLWQSVEQLPPYARALFAVFAARIKADSKPALNLLMQLSASSTAQLDLTGVDQLLQKHYNTKEVQRIVQSHAYVLTVMAAMLEAAREDGVQASADFLWLKPRDRRLWYMLNTVGRQTPFVEVAGPFAHWLAEKELGRPIYVPMVEEATNAVELALKEVVYRPDET